MQEKIHNISPIKQRILYLIDSLGVSKRKFYQDTGISRGTIESKTGITEEIMAKFLATYQNVSPGWLITGEGEMLLGRNEEGVSGQGPACISCRYLKDVERYQEDIARYKEDIHELRQELRTLRQQREPSRKRRTA